MRPVHILTILAAFQANGLQAHARSCAPVIFPLGAEITTVEEHVPKDLPLCYDFTARAGQTVTLGVAGPEDMNLGLDRVSPGGGALSVVDGLKAYTFKADEGTYRVYVASRKAVADTSRTFTLTVVRR